MKIKEILELSFTMRMDDIAKQVKIGEKRLRAIMKQAGCTHQAGKKGWIFTGEDPAILGRSIYDFSTPTAHTRKKDSNNTTKRGSIKTVKETTNKNIEGESDIKAEIQALISGKLASKPTKVYKGIYFDNDIATFLDNIQHGNKSELVNKIIRQYLSENDLL
jgi:hypothetical protein